MEAIKGIRLKLGSKQSIRSHHTNVFQPCQSSRFPLTPLSNSFGSKLDFSTIVFRTSKHHVPLKVATNTLACEDEENNRNFRELAPSEWGYQSLSTHVDLSEMDSLGEEIEALKPQLHDMIMSSKGNKEKILFIYLLVSLGVAYHFEDAINEILKDGFQKIEEIMMYEVDLNTVSIIFWVFRTYGYNISSDVFRRFKGDNGKFKECLAKDAKGILSLYEAAHMRTTTDYILDEAMSFTVSYLELLGASKTCKPNLSRRILNALDKPQHKQMEILVAKEYIKFYEQEKDCNKKLLKFAKTNFKFLQLTYLEELKILLKWNKEQDLESKLPPYYRDRMVELHLATLAYIEPKYSRVRIFLCMVYVVEIIIDDTCDRYASLSEVESFANAIERWDLDDHGMDGQPDYLKNVVKFIFDTYKEFERELRSEVGGPYSLQAYIEHTKKLVRSNLQLAKWARWGHLPSFDEYIDVAGVEIAAYHTLAGIFIAMKNICREEAFEWMDSRDKLVRVLSTKTKVMNDIHGYVDDMSRGYVTGSVNCYMKQYGVNEEEAFRKLHEIVANADKVINEEFLKPINVPREVLKIVINVLRMVDLSYATNDNYTRPGEEFKKYITSIYVDI